MDAFDADVLIYAAADDHPLGARVDSHLRRAVETGAKPSGVGSVLLLPELLTRPRRRGDTIEEARLLWYLGHLELWPVTSAVAALAVALGVAHGLGAVDATHLATAVSAGCDRFITNNTRDFDRSRITEIDIASPSDL